MKADLISTDNIGPVWLVIALVLVSALQLRATGAERTFQQTVGQAFRVAFNPDGARLEITHDATGASLVGKLSFAIQSDKGPQAWSVGMPRDSFESRLAILDGNRNVQGYVTFTGSSRMLRITTAHRAAQQYRGTLTYQARAELGKQTFACRTIAPDDLRVVQMASGPADSGLNDSLFDVATDTAVRFAGRDVRIEARDPFATGKPGFDVTLTAASHDPARTAVEVEVVPHFYRDRYVPDYAPINKERCPSPPTGWMSWNVYFDTAGEDENLAEARVAAEHLKPFGLEFWEIESWQDFSDKLPVSKFSNLTLRPNPRQFPHGMKWLADQIRKIGFRPGIWTVPFGTGDHEFYQAHKDWFLHDRDGKPMRNWCGLYVLDPSQEIVRKHMEDTHRTMSQDWGYEYFKIDGMSGRNHSYSAHFYERDEVRAAFKEPCDEPYRLCVEALRRGIGPDRVWLACQGHYTGPEIGLADAGRLGADIVAANNPPNWHNYAHQGATVLNQIFVNNIVWYCDPDTLLVGTYAPIGMARLATTVVGLPGQMMFAGDKLGELPSDRMRLLQQVLPVCDVRPLDLYPIFDRLAVWDLKIRRPFATWDVVSLFNWSDNETDIGATFDELGLAPNTDYIVFDFWDGVCRGVTRERLEARVPGRSNTLLAVHPLRGRPQFVSTDRHITQGGVSLVDLSWNPDAKTLSGRVRLVGGHASALAFYVPDGFAFSKATADGADLVRAEQRDDRTVRVTLRHADTGVAGFTLQF